MDYYDFSGLVSVRMSVLLSRTPVRCPTSVADAVCAVERVQTDALL